MSHHRTIRLISLALAVVVIVPGLASRRYGEHLPALVAEYAGDTLWAMAVFFTLCALVPAISLRRRVAIALVIAFAVEFSQLWHAPWLEQIRKTTPGHLILGVGFVWTDLICYTSGIALAAVCTAWLSPASIRGTQRQRK